MSGPCPRQLADLTSLELPPFTPQIIGWVRWSVSQLPEDQHLLTRVFYRELFTLSPESRPLFPEDITPQEDRLLGALLGVANALDRPALVESHLRRWGVVHRRAHGVGDELYVFVGQALVRTFNQLLSNVDSMIQSSWVAVYQWMAAVMIDAADQADAVDGNPAILLQPPPPAPPPAAMATVHPLRAARAPARPRRTAAGG